VPATKGLDTRELAQRLYRQGVVVEPGDVFFAATKPPRHFLRIGYSSIPVDRIEAGVRLIAQALAEGKASTTAPPGRKPAVRRLQPSTATQAQGL
jgi:GntR family transcriptional regulator / MocR family aminotransferase